MAWIVITWLAWILLRRHFPEIAIRAQPAVLNRSTGLELQTQRIAATGESIKEHSDEIRNLRDTSARIEDKLAHLRKQLEQPNTGLRAEDILPKIATTYSRADFTSVGMLQPLVVFVFDVQNYSDVAVRFHKQAHGAINWSGIEHIWAPEYRLQMKGDLIPKNHPGSFSVIWVLDKRLAMAFAAVAQQHVIEGKLNTVALGFGALEIGVEAASTVNNQWYPIGTITPKAQYVNVEVPWLKAFESLVKEIEQET